MKPAVHQWIAAGNGVAVGHDPAGELSMSANGATLTNLYQQALMYRQDLAELLQVP